MEFHAKLALLGLVAGATTASTGIGWGLITVPVLLLVLQVPPREAVGLSVLASIGCLISLAAYRYTVGGMPWSATLALTLGSLVGGLVGVATVDFIPALTVKRIIGVMTIIAGLALLIPWKD